MKKKSKKKQDSIEKIKTITSSYPFLYTVLILLLGIVFILGTLVFIKGKEKNKKTMVISLLEESNHSSMNLDLNQLKGKDYILKVTNYRGNSINEKEINYSITIKNPSNAKIKVTKDSSKDNMADKEEFVITDKLEKDGKKEDIYHIQLEAGETPSKGDKIMIEINN